MRYCFFSATIVALGICCASTLADEPLGQRTSSITTMWQEAWGHDPIAEAQQCAGGSVHPAILEVLSETDVRSVQDVVIDTNPSRDPRYEAIQVLGRGTFQPVISVQLTALAPSAAEIAARGLTDLQYYSVAGRLLGSTENTRHLVGFETQATFPDGSVAVILSPVSMETTSAEAVVQAASNAAVLLHAVGANYPPHGQPPAGVQPAPPGSVWCYCPSCYLDCLEQMDCDGTYDDAIALCDSIHATCMAGAQTVYDCCIAGCPCAGSPGIWCTALCYACFLNQGVEQGVCWVARIGCLSGAELGKTTCYSGCYLGSWITYPDPPGCP